MSILTSKVLLFTLTFARSFKILVIAHTSFFSFFLFCNIVTSGQPSLISDDPEAVTLTGSSQDAANQINQKEIHWGVRPLFYLQNLTKLGIFLLM
jgi:hypothetical protein